MMKKIILGLILLMISSMVVATSYDSSTGNYVVSIYKGWNMVPRISMGTSDCDIKTMLSYSTIEKTYFGANSGQAYPNQETALRLTNGEFLSKNLSETPNSQPYYGVMNLGAFWIYSEKNCSVNMGYGSPESSYYANKLTVTSDLLQKHPLKQGWNFININPWMLDKKYQDIFKSCDLTALNVWNSDSQSWVYTSSVEGARQLDLTSYPVRAEDIGRSLIVKVANDCYLSYGSSTVAPPTLPN